MVFISWRTQGENTHDTVSYLTTSHRKYYKAALLSGGWGHAPCIRLKHPSSVVSSIDLDLSVRSSLCGIVTTAITEHPCLTAWLAQSRGNTGYSRGNQSCLYASHCRETYFSLHHSISSTPYMMPGHQFSRWYRQVTGCNARQSVCALAREML